MDTIFKTFRAEVKGIDEDGSLNMFIPVSTDSVDRDGEVVEPTAFRKTLPKFMKRPVLVSSHDYRDLTSQIGEWTKLKITENGIEGKPKYYIGQGNEQADWGYKLASKGMAAFSIGFIPKVWEDGDGTEKSPRRTYKEVELLEISQVIVPSNRDAIQGIRSKSVDDPVMTQLLDDIEQAEIIDATEEKQSEVVTKPEETDEYIRIPVRECKVTATIDISKKEGIKALYCGESKQVATYLFAKDKGWTMEKAREWVKEHEKKQSREVSQAEIADEIDYLKELIEREGLSPEAKSFIWELVRVVMRVSGNDIPVDIKESFSQVLDAEVKESDKADVLKSLVERELEEAARKEAEEAERLGAIHNVVALALAAEEEKAERSDIDALRKIIKYKLEA